MLKASDEWRVETNEATLKYKYSGEPLINESLSEMAEERLDFALARFISEVRREDGQEYPWKTLDEMIGSIQTFLRQLKEKNCHKGSRCGCQSG